MVAANMPVPVVEQNSKIRSNVLLWGIILLAFVLRIAALAIIYPSPPVDEEAVYSFQAIFPERALRPAPDDQRSPGVLAVYRLTAAAFGPNRTILRIPNVIFGTLTLVLLYAWARRLAGEKIALVTIFLTAIHPELVLYSASLYNEPLYLLLAYAAFLFYLNLAHPPVLWQSVVFGVLLAMTALTREIGLFLLPFALLAIALRRPIARSSLAAALCLGTFMLTVLPWSLHMSKRAGHPVLISEMNARRFFIGNLELPDSLEINNPLAARHPYGYKAYQNLSDDPRERQALARQMIWGSIRNRLPSWLIEKVREELPNFFTPNSLPAARWLGLPSHPNWEGRCAYRLSFSGIDRGSIGWTLGMFTVAFHVAMLLAGTPGLVLLRLGKAAIPILVFALVHLAPTLATSSCSRYRLPLTPLWILGAAGLIVQGPLLWRTATWKRRIAAMVALVLITTILAQRMHSVLPPQYG